MVLLAQSLMIKYLQYYQGLILYCEPYFKILYPFLEIIFKYTILVMFDFTMLGQIYALKLLLIEISSFLINVCF